MKISVGYKIVGTIYMEVSDEFKSLQRPRFVTKNDKYEWKKKANALEEIILKELPENAEIFAVIDTETSEFVWEN